MNSSIKDILKKAGLEAVTIEPIVTLQNEVYNVQTFDGNVFLKIFSQEPHLVKKLFSLYPLLKAKGVPVPEVLYANTEGDRPSIILSGIEGERLESAKTHMTADELNTFYEELGDALGNIHSITFDSFGESIDGKTVVMAREYQAGPFTTWKELHQAIIAHRLSHLENTIFADLIEPVQEYFAKNAFLIDYEIVPRLLHIDLNQKNIFVKDKHMSGIIDFDGSFVGHNEEELMRTASANFCDDSDLRDAFFKGYTKHVRLDDGYESRRPYYFLSRLLVHADCLVLFGSSYEEDIQAKMSRVKNEMTRIISGETPDYTVNK